MYVFSLVLCLWDAPNRSVRHSQKQFFLFVFCFALFHPLPFVVASSSACFPLKSSVCSERVCPVRWRCSLSCRCRCCCCRSVAGLAVSISRNRSVSLPPPCFRVSPPSLAHSCPPSWCLSLALTHIHAFKQVPFVHKWARPWLVDSPLSLSSSLAHYMSQAPSFLRFFFFCYLVTLGVERDLQIFKY